MLNIDKHGNIRISRGDSANILTIPEKVMKDGATEPIILTENARVIFTVKSRYSGNTLIKRILTSDDYIDNALSINIKSSETDTVPYGYRYSFMYVPDINNTDEAYTYAQGEFEILESITNINDLGGNKTDCN